MKTTMTKITFFLSVAYYVAHLTTAKLEEVLNCPTKKYLTAFNETMFEGKWYEIKRLPNSLINDDCCEAVYTRTSDNYNLSYLMRNISANKPTEINMVLKPFPSPACHLGEYEIFIDDKADPVPHIVLKTDYYNYSIVWGCGAKDSEIMQRIFIYSRNVVLNENTIAEITSALEELSINEEDLLTVEQDKIKCGRNCAAKTVIDFGTSLLLYLAIKHI